MKLKLRSAARACSTGSAFVRSKFKITKLAGAFALAVAVIAALLTTAGPAQASSGQACRQPYTLKVGDVSWTLTPCVQWADGYSAATGLWQTYIWGWTDASNGSTDVYIYAEVGSQYCIPAYSCGSVSWIGDTTHSDHVYPENIVHRTYVAHTVPVDSGAPGSQWCYRVKSSMHESSIGTVGDIESPPACF